MKRYIIVIGLLMSAGFTSCNKFLEENPRTSIGGEAFFSTPTQIESAVQGAYLGLERPYTSLGLGLPTGQYWSIESMTGLSINKFGTGPDETNFQNLEKIDDQSAVTRDLYQAAYKSIANANNVIDNIKTTDVVVPAVRDKYLGEMYFLRAWHYFRLVQLFGEVPLVTTFSTSVEEEVTQVPKATRQRIYDQIVADLVEAEKSGLDFRDSRGRVCMAAVKSLLAKVYITMAGAPMLKGQAYYQLAYEKAKEVIAGMGPLNTTYTDLRTMKNTGEHIFQVQRAATIGNNELPIAMLPNKDEANPPLNATRTFKASLEPVIEFYNTYDANDVRKQEKVFFYHYNATDPTKVMNYKFWEDGLLTGSQSAQNIWLIRYADVLLLCAEAKASADGGNTTDADAINAYWQVRNRARPDLTVKPTTLNVDDVLKERHWELAFEFVIWYDMLRTRKAFDLPNNQMVPLIGYKSVMRVNKYEEEDLVFPLPLVERQKNPKLDQPAE